MRIVEMWKFYKGLRGDNLRRTGDSAYISSGAVNGGVAVNTNWRPRQYRVHEIYNDYLVCNPHNASNGSLVDKDIKIAKPQELRSGDEVWTTEPAYVPDSSVIWAAAMRGNGAQDADGNQIILQDMNYAGRRCDVFWARIDSATGGTNNQWSYTWTEMKRTASGWEVLTDGRAGSTAQNTSTTAVNAIEAHNDDSGVEGNGINIEGSVFDDNSGLAMQSARGTPIVRMRQTFPENGGGPVHTFEYVNAIDGSCAS